MHGKNLIFPVLAALAFSAACSARFSATVNFSAAESGRIIVLPFENLSNSVRAQEFLRKRVVKRLAEKGYDVPSPEFVDGRLRKELGITDGGQLGAVEIADLRKVFGRCIFLYGTIEDFTFQNLGFIIRKKVVLRVKMLDSETGILIYENEGRGSDTRIYTSREDAKKAFLKAAAFKLVDNMFNAPLAEESEEALAAIFAKIPKNRRIK